MDQIAEAIAALPPSSVPRVIHQIWLGPHRVPRYTIQSCRDANPGWLHVLWTDATLPPLVNQRVFDAFGRIYYAKADVLRYEVLRRFGGVYVDADQLCLRPFAEVIGETDTFVAGFQDVDNPDLDPEQRTTPLIANAVIAAAPAHPILDRIIEDIAAGVDVELPAWTTVGPAALTRAIERTHARAVIMPFHTFYPYHANEPIPEHPSLMVKAIHYGSCSVSLWGSTRGTYARCRRAPWGQPPRAAVPADFAARHPRLAPTVYHA